MGNVTTNTKPFDLYSGEYPQIHADCKSGKESTREHKISNTVFTSIAYRRPTSGHLLYNFHYK